MENSSQINDVLKELILELTEFNANDPLVNLSHKKSFPWSENPLPISIEEKKILTEAKKLEKEQGIYPLCLGHGSLTFNFKGKSIQSPLFLHEVRPILNKIKSEIIWEVEWDEWQINPFLQKYLELGFEKENADSTDSKGIISKKIASKGIDVDMEIKVIGNFHHHRYALLKDAEGLLSAKDLSSIKSLLIGNSQKEEVLPLGQGWLFPLDGSQEKAISSVLASNTVVQGPPGTGKSQVIANIIGKAIYERNWTLVCSQKRPALEVIEQKMIEKGLGDLCLLRSSRKSTKEVISELKLSWEKMEFTQHQKIEDNFFQLNFDVLQNLLNIYNTNGLVGGMSPKDFLEKNRIKLVSLKKENIDYPDYNLWIQNKKLLDSIPSEIISSLSIVDTSINLSSEYKKVLEKSKDILDKISILGLENENLGTIHSKYQLAQSVHTFSTSFIKKFENLVPKKSKILKLEKQYNLLKTQLISFEIYKDSWVAIPTPGELDYLISKFETQNWSSYFTIRRLHKKWFRHPLHSIKELFQETKRYFEHKIALQNITVVLLGLGFESLESELPSFKSFLSQLNSDVYKQFLELTDDDKNKYGLQFLVYNTLYHDLKSTFNLELKDNPYKRISNLVSEFSKWSIYSKNWSELDKSIKMASQKCNNVNDLEERIISSTWTNFLIQFPSFSAFLTDNFLEKIIQLNKLFNSETNAFSLKIQKQRLDKFNAYHQLMALPNQKLSEEEKKLKIELKKGKSKLIKAFTKQRNLPSIRELMNPDTLLWIQILKPIWLTNPMLLAEDFPLENNLFGIGILDESSQIPLSHGLGSMYRSKRIVIAGDSQQMSPSSFFQSNQSENVSLLDHAAFYLPSYKLQYHYRSENPALIDFSNQHFYNNSLISFPSSGSSEKAIQWHYIENAIYQDGVNLKEAKWTAEFLRSKMKLNAAKLGVVAFSANQLQAILNYFSPQEQSLIEELQDKDLLFFKTLDQVQGDECDEIIISFGYAYSEKGTFDMRFGPVNLDSGSKRLNVLFSRAKKTIHFISSVKSSDFSLSNNESIRILLKWFIHIENPLMENKNIFKVHHFRQLDEKTLEIKNLADWSTNVFDLMSLTLVLKNRGWNLIF